MAVDVTATQTGYSITELRALVLRMLRVSDTTRYSPTAGTADYDWIDDSLNRAQSRFVRRTRCLRTYAVIELVSGYRVYRLPWNFIDFMTAYFYNSSLTGGYKELKVTTVEELNNEISDWRTATGTPSRIYIDKMMGNNWQLGLYKIPDADGGTIDPGDYGSVVDWVCPNLTYNSEYTVIYRSSGDIQFIVNTSGDVVAQIESMDNNLLIEYYRLPSKLLETADDLGMQGTQYPEIPREYQEALVYYAASDLLQNNPEDSAEYKRAMTYMGQFEREVQVYLDERKRPLSGHNLRATPAVWTWMNSMDWYADQP